MLVEICCQHENYCIMRCIPAGEVYTENLTAIRICSLGDTEVFYPIILEEL